MTTEREIAERVDGLRRRFLSHVNLGRYGHLYVYEVIDHRDRVVANISKRSIKNNIEIEIEMNDRTFSTFREFRAAYEQKLRDEEWEAATPKK